MWTEKETNYTGKHYLLTDAICEPKPVQKPHPPIIIGGGGEKLTLRVSARHADRFDWGFIPSLDDYKHKLHTLEYHCEAVGRNFDDIEKSCWPASQIFFGKEQQQSSKMFSQKNQTKLVTPEDYIQTIRNYVDLDVTYYMLFFGDLPSFTGLRLFTEKVIHAAF